MYEDDFAPKGVRLSKLLAKRGLASRRKAETLIEEGRITVNGETVEGVVFVDPESDDIRMDGKALPREPDRVWYVMYKPRGTITGRDDPRGRKSVLDLLEGVDERVEPVGRLDYDTEGALLFTNDGDLAHKLLHPSRKVPKRYMAKVYRKPDENDLKALREGVFLDDGRTAPAKVRIVDSTDTENTWLEITVTEGRNRLIRRMLAKLGHPVSKLRRESFATVSIRGLERKQVRKLTRSEIARLGEIAQGKKPQKAGHTKGKGFAKAKPKRKRITRTQKKRDGKSNRRA